MTFSQSDRDLLLAVKGVGPKVVERLEQVGIAGLADLAGRNPADLCAAIAFMLGAPCWKNSPKAQAALAAAVARAREASGNLTDPAGG